MIEQVQAISSSQVAGDHTSDAGAVNTARMLDLALLEPAERIIPLHQRVPLFQWFRNFAIPPIHSYYPFNVV